MAAIMEGNFSYVGRATGRALHRLNTQVDLANEQLKRKKPHEAAAAETGAKDAGAPSPMARSVRDALSLTKGRGKGSNRAATSAAASDPVAVAAADADSRGSADDAEAEEAAQPTKQKLDPCFRNQGHEDKVYCDNAVAVLHRWVAPCKTEERPPIAHYQASHELIKERQPKWDFAKTQGRKPIVPQPLDEPGELSGSLADTSQWGSTISRKSRTAGVSSPSNYLTLSKPHADLAGPKALAPGRLWTGTCQLQNQMVSTAPEDMLDQDRQLSTVPRRPLCDLSKAAGRKGGIRETYFEVGKYKVKYDAVSSAPKVGSAHSKITSRDVLMRSRSQPAAILDKDDEDGKGHGGRLASTGTGGIIYNRCMHRDTSETRPRITHVMEMDKVIERPSFFQASAVYYDKDDPEIAAATLQQELVLDKNVIDKSVTARRDHGPDMSRALPRHGPGRGYRICQGDLGVRQSLGYRYPEFTHEREGTIESCKESPSRLRPDIGHTFDQTKGRAKGNYLNLSSLRKPREMAFGDFERIAPRTGFSTRVGANIPQVLRPSRTFEALPGFDASMCDNGDWDDV
eukprot:TRINITY_DN33744_c0_g1_i1.p1 TRINITY_DN33744_c0_g1~~TRINITY_DN33744_c0_g1_i1.p1  ORF type:complete len:578 (-),score=109.94 TRINITY_DN33744_c0_g1_i1:74-1786(-)